MITDYWSVCITIAFYRSAHKTRIVKGIRIFLAAINQQAYGKNLNQMWNLQDKQSRES